LILRHARQIRRDAEIGVRLGRVRRERDDARQPIDGLDVAAGRL